MDISVLFVDRALALKQAKKYNQIAIWDLKDSREISAGGTGTALEHQPDVMERLIQ